MEFFGRRAAHWSLILLFFIATARHVGRAQDASEGSSSGGSWTTSSELKARDVTANPTRTTTTHSEVNGRTVEKTVTEALGPDGRYVPYSEVERESVRVNDATVQNIERSYGRADGQRVLTQETREEERSFPDGARKVSRTTSNPDGNGGLQVVQRAVVDSKQVDPGVRETKTTVWSADGTGGLSPSVQIDEREVKRDANTINFTRSTSLADGAGHWAVSEVREGTSSKEAGGIVKDETVRRPDANGRMTVAERTVTRQSAAGPGERNESTATYSTDVPGQAGGDTLQLVKRESTVQRTGTGGASSTVWRVEKTNPGDPGAGLRVTQEAIDIVRPGANGTASQSSTILNADPNGHLNTVWVDIGQTNNPAVVKVDVAPAKK
ncbi:MAG TPA: hypothetical protein VMU05_02875 [Dongiaceae bacterium]|nr:hypothetical protein [Dongiaceae bacterium]